jgi:hypothetical protein
VTISPEWGALTNGTQRAILRTRRHKRSSKRSVPIEDFSGSMSLSFSRLTRFDEVKASIEECKEKDMTYCRAAVRHRGVHQQHHR